MLDRRTPVYIKEQYDNRQNEQPQVCYTMGKTHKKEKGIKGNTFTRRKTHKQQRQTQTNSQIILISVADQTDMLNQL